MARLTEVPAYESPVWVDDKVTNKGDLPLWSGKGPPPAIGSEVELTGRRDENGNRFRAKITHYEIDAGWLMACGYRLEDPAKQGNLAGMEIHYPEVVQ